MNRVRTSLLVAVLGFSAIALFAASRGQRLPAGDTRQSVQVGGLKREFAFHVPANLPANGKAPLLLVFHGGGGHAWRMSKFTKFDEIADENGFVVAYPEAINKSWDDTRGLSKADDVGFVRTLIEHFERQFPIDSSRVYATGISNGGFFANRLACDLSDKIAAIAAVAATMPTTLPENCHPARPISVLYMNGTKDPLVPINGGEVGASRGLHRGECISLADAVSFWTKWDETSKAPETEQLPDRVNDGTHVQMKTYSHGKDGTKVVVYRIEGGGHAWPGGSQYLPKMMVGKASRQIDGSKEIWEFLKKRRLG